MLLQAIRIRSIKSFANYLVVGLFLAITFSIVSSDTTFAAYPGDACTFQYPGDKNSITTKCNDDPGNGTLDGAVYKLTGPNTYSYNQKYNIEVGPSTLTRECTSTIRLGGGISAGTISGQYVLPGTISQPKCIDLDTATIPIDAGLYDTAQLSKKMFNALTKSSGKLAEEIRAHCKDQAGGNSGSAYTRCLLTANAALKTCHESVLAEAFIAVTGGKDFATIYKTKMRECISGKLPYLTNAAIRDSLNDAVAAQDKFENTPVIDVEEEQEDGTSCALDNIGWIICPVASTIAKFNDSLFSILERLLGVNPSMFDTSGNNAATYATWKAVRNIANAAFVIAFLIIIYSQLTGAGITNYGMKKMLPKLVIAAVLVNLSFWACAIAVDISNILGSSVHDLFTDYLGNASGTQNNLGGWDQLTGWLLAGGGTALAVGGAAITIGTYGFLGALALLIPLGVTALIAVLTVVFVLTARQAFIIILVVISPLAFVAYLLPNTESWFDKWRKFFFSLLLIYPIIGALFGGSQLAAAIIRAGADDALTYILSLVVQVVPLFLVPIILRFSGGLIGKVAGMINNPNRGPFDRMKKAGASFAERRKGFRMDDRVARTNAIRKGKNGIDGGGGIAFGKVGSRRRRAAAWVSGIGNTNVKDREEKDKYAKVLSDASLRKYNAERAKDDDAYATSIAGGNASAALLVQSYARKAVREEDKKDIEAIRESIADTKTDDFVAKMSGSADKHASAAYAAEIAKRGPGAQFHEALEASKLIQDPEHRRLVQNELLTNMREDHFGVSDEMRGKLAVGEVDQSYVVKDPDTGKARQKADGSAYDSIYQASLDVRMERKMSPDYAVSMKPHDMTAVKIMAESGVISDSALQSMINNMSAAEQNENTKIKIKDETKDMFDKLWGEAQRRGMTAKTPTGQPQPATQGPTLTISRGTPGPGNLPPGPGQPPASA